MPEFTLSDEHQDFNFETQETKQRIIENFPNPEKVFEKRDRKEYKQISTHELISIPLGEAQPKSVYIQPDAAVAVDKTADAVTTNQYGCVVPVLQREGRRLMAHIRPDSLKQNEMGYMYHGSPEEEQEMLRQQTAEKMALLLGGDLKGTKGVLLCNIASDSEQSGEYNYKNQHKVWESLRQKLESLGAQVGILESPLDHTTTWLPKNSENIVLTGYKAANTGLAGETQATSEVFQTEINLEEASKQISLLPHKDYKTKRPKTELKRNPEDLPTSLDF